MLERLKRMEVLLNSWGRRSFENERRARGDLRSIENSRKVRDGALAGLLDPALLAAEREAEKKLRANGRDRADLASATDAWDRIARAQQEMAARAVEFDLLESGSAFQSRFFNYARQLLRAAEERDKPNGERLEEYRDSAMASVELALTAEQPVYRDLETLKLADSLTYLAEKLGAEAPLVKTLMAGRSPRARAAELTRGSQLDSGARRRELFVGGKAALQGGGDPMIELSKAVDLPAREVRKFMEIRREAIRQAQAQIGKVRYAVSGPGQYPDATGSLRLAFGTARGYEEEGKPIPFQTVYGGLYERAERHGNQPPFDLPARWQAARDKLDLSVPFNFVCTADIIGGNSGSPVVNRAGEFVGIIFDGNIHSLATAFAYREEHSRAVAVHSGGILEALEKVYAACGLVAELGRNESSPSAPSPVESSIRSK